ncbi:hypothetical protein CDL12_02593 [Handroanthus impetiginosus]|uniref:DUF247 domain-containing protein n=1 Tax=Handroanthus impetiginosus TaxID=429701 RepID=A0A2G9I4I2_9LAMI|nr:hypothetical protein CDL12_02593 [Handroanthus impetiginosus]
MVAVFNKELLSWYLITLKLNQAIESGLQNAQSPTNSRSIEFPETTQPQNQEDQLPSIKDEETGNVEEVQAKPLESEWVISIKEKLNQAQLDDVAGVWAKLSIYKIPKCLREAGDEKAYIPQVVSLGPYHHGKRRLCSMERHKKARACYEGPICLCSNEFVKMMVLDGCFILELFRGATGGFTELGYSRNDPIFAMRGTMHSIERDMIMLENQIPLFILDRLLGIQSGNPDQKGVVARLALRFFDPLMPTDEPLTKSDRNKLATSLGKASTFDPLTEQGGLHYLKVFRRSLVIDLKEAGIKFKRRNTDRFWDIKFKNGVLKIVYLLYCGIIENWLGSDAEVAELFNRLCQEVVFDINDSSLSRLSELVNKYYEHRWNVWRAILKHKYFCNPWAIISFIAAMVLLVLTFAQTFYSVYGYYRPPS